MPGITPTFSAEIPPTTLPAGSSSATARKRPSFSIMMYGVAETLASRIHQQEEYIGVTPVIAILPWFFAGALFPIGVLPGALSTFAKFLPLTHVLALMRYGMVDPRGSSLHDIWGLSDTTTEAWLSLAVVLLFAAAFLASRFAPSRAPR